MLREENLPRHFQQPEKPGGTPGEGPAVEEPEEAPLVREGELGKDPQLDRGLELLKSWNVFKAVVAQQGP